LQRSGATPEPFTGEAAAKRRGAQRRIWLAWADEIYERKHDFKAPAKEKKQSGADQDWF
jgi:hypothetical protein